MISLKRFISFTTYSPIWGLFFFLLSISFLLPSLESKEIIHFAFFDPDTESKNPLTAVSAIKPFADYIGQNVGVDIQVHYFLRKKDLQTFISQHKVGIALLHPLFIIENKDRLGLIPFAGPFLGDEMTYQSTLVVRKSDGYQTIQDLKGKTFAYTAMGDNNFDFLNRVIFDGQVIVETFFSKLIEASSPSSAVFAVLFKDADCAYLTAGLFEVITELNPRINRELTRIYTSPKIRRPSMCFFRDNISPELREKIARRILDMHETPFGQQTLLPFKVDGFRPITYDVFKPLVAQLSASSAPLALLPKKKKQKEPDVNRILHHPDKTGTGITKIEQTYVSDKNSVLVTVQINPNIKTDVVKMIYQVNNDPLQRMTMIGDSTGSFSATIPVPPSSTAPESDIIIYEVQPGDTLAKISQKSHGKLKKGIQIAAFNQLPSPDRIYVHQRLRLKRSGHYESVPVKLQIEITNKAGELILSDEQISSIVR
ncbi:PhnD/SsuA/transferrin family substrate-binding protein [candidate division CSSED10-310 bacterium]|uniref:PhnD/SsuA/transferrin family substrate-binding protein n=1 Tax=candidate division CSSED10-310 bacterium TaxID=2855610 RepID=A0ABV6YS51_UNCC1